MATSNPLASDLKRRDDSSSLQELKARPVRIWNIGDPGAGTVFFGRDNFLGFANVLRDEISQGKAPDLLALHGGLLSDIPQFGTRGYRSKALILAQSIESVDRSV